MVSPSMIGFADYFESASEQELDASAANLISVGNVSDVLPAIEQIVLNYVVPNGKKAALIDSKLTGNGVGRFSLYKNGSIVEISRTSYFTRDVKFSSSHRLASGDTLQVKVKNDSIQGEKNDYEVFLYLKEDVL